MKRLLQIISLFLVTAQLHAQDIPIFSQKITNSFIFNPAVAGHSHGSLTYSFRRSFGQVQNAPRTNFISVHTPVADHRFGIGANVFQEEVNFLTNTYASGAFAYHVKFDQSNVLSFGVSGEYNSLRLSGRTNSNAEDIDYLRLANGPLNDMDFSFGMLFHNQYVKAGVAANRLATGWIRKENEFILSNFYSGYLQGMIPVRGGDDMIEPYVAFRKFSENNNSLDIGLYYTYNDMIKAGAAFRNGPVGSLTAGFRINKKLLLGYTHEVFLGDIRSQVGSTNEITLRLDFKEYSYKTNFKADYRNAMVYRKKTLSSLPPPKSPGQFHKRQKKYAKYSPNKRYQGAPPKYNPSKKKGVMSSKKKKPSSKKKKPAKKRKR